jgi:hypothetical protein
VSTERPEPAGENRTASGRHTRVEAEHVDVGQASIHIQQADIENTPASRKSARRMAWSLIVLFVIVIGIGTANLLFTNNQASINHCQRVVNARFQQADISRVNATKASGEAQIELWNSLFALHGTQAQQRAEFIKVFSGYKIKLRQVTAVQYPDRTGIQACSG